MSASRARTRAGESGFSSRLTVLRARAQRRVRSSATRASAAVELSPAEGVQVLAALPQRDRLVQRGRPVLELADDLLELVAGLLEGRARRSLGHLLTRAPRRPAARRTPILPPASTVAAARAPHSPARPGRSHSRARASRPARAAAADRGRSPAAPPRARAAAPAAAAADAAAPSRRTPDADPRRGSAKAGRAASSWSCRRAARRVPPARGRPGPAGRPARPSRRRGRGRPAWRPGWACRRGRRRPGRPAGCPARGRSPRRRASAGGDRPAEVSSENGSRSSTLPPPRASTITSTRVGVERPQRPGDPRRRAGALHRRLEHPEAGRRVAFLRRLDHVALGRRVAAADQADRPRQERQRSLAFGSEQPLGSQPRPQHLDLLEEHADPEALELDHGQPKLAAPLPDLPRPSACTRSPT